MTTSSSFHQPQIRVTNVTRDRLLVTDGQVADGSLTRLRGLIGRRSLEPGQGLLIVPCHSIHMFFMAFPIDVLYVSAELEVIGIDHAIRPWRIGKPRPRSRFVVETPAGTTKATETQTGDRLRLDGYSLRHPLWLRFKPW